MPRLSEQQLDERLLGLGASDLATAAGVNPFQTPYELYLTKIGELDPDATLDDAARGRLERGHRLEDVALEWDRDITGESFVRVRRTIWHSRVSVMFCHPDAARDRKLTRLIEVKTSARAWKEIPRHVVVQVQAQLACTGARGCDVLVQTFDGPPTRWVVERDDLLIHALEGLAVAFWDRVERRDPPPMDGSSGVSHWLDRTTWRDEPELRADVIQRDLITKLLDGRATKSILEAEDATLVNMIKETMAGSSRLSAPGLARINWIAPFSVRSVAWKEVASAYRHLIEDVRGEGSRTETERTGNQRSSTALAAADLDAIESLYTTEREQRQFKIEDLREETA